jgi:hypothetical protein
LQLPDAIDSLGGHSGDSNTRSHSSEHFCHGLMK